MIKKSILRLIIGFGFICLLTTTADAQPRFGIIAGPHSASVFESNAVADWFTVRDDYKSRFSFHGGVTLDVPFPNN